MAKMSDDIGRTVYVDNPTSAFHGRSGVVEEIDVAMTRVDFGDRHVWFLGSELRYDRQTAYAKKSKLGGIAFAVDPEIPALISELLAEAENGDHFKTTRDLMRRAAKALARMVTHVAD